MTSFSSLPSMLLNILLFDIFHTRIPIHQSIAHNSRHWKKIHLAIEIYDLIKISILIVINKRLNTNSTLTFTAY